MTATSPFSAEIDVVANARLPRGRHSLEPSVVATSQRARMLQAIVDAVAEKGYAAATVGDVIRRARVSRTTFYGMFADKEACFLAAYDAGARIHLESVRAASIAAQGWLERMRAGAHAYLDVLASNPPWARATVVEVVNAGPRANERRAHALRAYVDLVRQGYRQAQQETGGLPDLPDELFEAAVGGVHELVFERIRRGDVEKLGDLEPILLHIWLSLFGLTVLAGAATP